MFLNKLFLLVTGLAGGIITAAGIVALINVVSIVPRLAAKTRTAGSIHLYETSITLGGTVGNLHTLYSGKLPLLSSLRFAYSLAFALFSGIYIGCLIMALAETLQVMPIFIRHIRLKKGLALMLLSFALGKLAGSLWYFLFF
jgi:stage V sporulation protein AB